LKTKKLKSRILNPIMVAGSIAERVPELLFRLDFGDSLAALQLGMIAESKPLILNMLKSRNPILSGLASILGMTNKSTAAWLGRMAIKGGVAQDSQQGEKKLLSKMVDYTKSLLSRGMKNQKLVVEEIRQRIDENSLSKDELKEVIRSIPKEELARIKKSIAEMDMEQSNRNIAAYYTHGKEITNSYLANVAYGILTRSGTRRAFPSEKGEKRIREIISKCINEDKPILLVGSWGGYKESASGMADKADNEALDKLKETVDKLVDKGIKAKILIRFMVGHSLDAGLRRVGKYAESYTRDLRPAEQLADFSDKARNYSFFIKLMAEKRGFEFRSTLSEHVPMAIEANEKEKELLAKFYETASDELKGLLKDAAEKHSEKRDDDPERPLRYYIVLRSLEKDLLETKYRGAIFFSYGEPVTSYFLPENTIFWYSIGRLSNPPWYIDYSKLQQAPK